MTKAVFTTKVSPTYDDQPEERYHFPRTYLNQARAAVGDWIVYYEPRRQDEDDRGRAGRQAYFAIARVTGIRADPRVPDHFYADVADYLDFRRAKDGYGEIAAYVAQNSDQQSSLLLVFGVAFMIVGIAFKLGAVPFHMWLPDIYEGSPTAVTLFISTAPKVAGFAMAIRVLADGMQGLLPDWQGMLTILAVLSIVTLSQQDAGGEEGAIAYTLAALKDWTFLLGTDAAASISLNACASEPGAVDRDAGPRTPQHGPGEGSGGFAPRRAPDPAGSSSGRRG